MRDHGHGALLAGQHRLPGLQVRPHVEVSGGNTGQSLGGDPREDVRAVDQLVTVDQRAQAVGLAREAASRSPRDGILLARMRVGGDRRRACGAGLAECGREPVVERHQPVEADGQRVRRLVGIGVGVGQLDSGDQQQAIGLQCPLGLLRDRLQVGVVRRAVDHRAGRVIRADDVVGDAEHVEAGHPVKVDQLLHGQGAVTPRCVRVQLAEQGLRRDRSSCHARMLPRTPVRRGGDAVCLRGRSGEVRRAT